MFVMGRKLHVIDIENALGSGLFTLAAVHQFKAAYEASEHWAPGDQVIVAASSQGGAVAAGFGWQGARLMWQAGSDGADECLISVLDSEDVGGRFDWVVVVSGDHAFASSVARLGAQGCAVTVLSRTGALSPQLRLAARHVHTPIWMDDLTVAATPTSAA